ncbi:phosphonate ABC transporter, permease protein PhnE [Roseovarius sp. D0-M9]|uniref:phosphonate ABC transporter, permease protein PhnE n=1 Tax=Roseovarius sp. D0-M9 TaxID=3127117 RepID=UPI00300FA63D
MPSHTNARVPTRSAQGQYLEPSFQPLSGGAIRSYLVVLALLGAFVMCLRIAEVDPARLIEGLPRLMRWASTAWPPYVNDLDRFLYRALETVAIATVATVAATIVAFPLSIFISRNIVASNFIGTPVRGVLNALRGIDTVVFAILFVAAVGLGPFAGVLGMTLHAIGVIAKLNSEAIEMLPRPPMEAVEMSGANRSKLVMFAVLPASLPSLASTSLYVWEANVRTSTILGIVGAGGIGIEIKSAIDLLDFEKLLTLTVIVLAMVTIIDQISAYLRRWLV